MVDGSSQTGLSVRNFRDEMKRRLLMGNSLSFSKDLLIGFTSALVSSADRASVMRWCFAVALVHTAIELLLGVPAALLAGHYLQSGFTKLQAQGRQLFAVTRR